MYLMKLFYFTLYSKNKGFPLFLTINIVFLLLASSLSARGQAPAITSFSPATVCQGDVVTITGTNFTGTTNVKLGSDNAANFTVKNADTITAVVSYKSAPGKIVVITPKGTDTSSGSLTIKPASQPVLDDVSAVDIPFTNCDGNSTYTLIVKNSSELAGGGPFKYDIDWGDKTTHFTQTDWSIGLQTSHTYQSQGYFNIKFTITSNNQCTTVKTYKFYNGANPIASFTTALPTTGLCADTIVDFKIGNWFNNSAGTSYQIDFGDGSTNEFLQHPLNTTNTDQILPHKYTSSSCPNIDFTARLFAINGCFTTEYTLNQIVVRIKPKADFNTQEILACVNEPVCFTNESTNGYSGTSCNTTSNFTWKFGDGSSSANQATPSCHTYSAPGTYPVTLIASNAACGSDSTTKTIVVKDISSIPTVSATPVTYCQGQAAAPLTATGTNLLWYTSATGGSGSSTAPIPSTNTAGTYTYYVTQTVSNSCESPRVQVKITVNATPAAPTVHTPVALCQGQTATPLTATGSNLLWYTTASGGTGIADAPTPSTATAGSGTYYVSQTVSGCEGARAAIVVVVGLPPVVPVVISPVTYCQGQTAAPLTATGTNLLWYTTATGGNGSPTAPTPATINTGTTTFYVSQSNGCGEGERAAITVIVNSSPSATLAYDNTVLCNKENSTSSPNLPVSATITGSKGGTFSIWPENGLPIDAATGTLTPSGAVAGNYTITYTIQGTGGCADFKTTATISVSSTPNASIAYPAICTSEELVQVQLLGTTGGTFTSATGLSLDASTGSIAPGSSTPGSYTVTYTIPASQACPGFTTTTNVIITKASSAVIAYSPANLCNIVNTATTPNLPVAVTLTGTTGGRYTILPSVGLSINANNGTINPSGATAGTYTITYAVAGNGGCADYSTTAIVTVNSAPKAAISYPAAPFCRGMNTLQPVSFSGTTGGSFSATTGLAIDAITGAINPSLSTAGIYTVTYTIPPSPPCPGFDTTTIVLINETPAVTFPLDSKSICSGDTAVFMPSSTVANTVFSWSVAGTLPNGISGVSTGITAVESPDIVLSFVNSSLESQTLTIQVVPFLPNQSLCAGAPYNLTLTVYPIPAVPATDTAGFCMHSPSTALMVNASNGNTVNWYDQNWNVLNAAPVINTIAPAQFTYYASQSSSFGCESQKAQILAIVHPVAKIISASYTNPTTCGIASGAVVLKVLDLNDAPLPNYPLLVHYTKFQTAYQVPDSTDATGQIVVPLTAGTYSDFYVATNGCASQQIPNVFVLSDPNPPAKPVAGYNAPLCSEDTLNLSALSPTSTLAGPIDYVWVGPAFGSFADTSRNTVVSIPSVTTNDAGIYIVYAIQNNCISPPASFQVVVKQSPSKPQIVTRNPLCTGDDLSLQAYSSIPGNNTLNYTWTGPGSGFPVHAPNAGISNVAVEDAGIYSVTSLSPQTGCSSTTDTLIQIGGYPVVKFLRDTFTLTAGYLLKLSPFIINATEPHILPMQQFAWTPTQDLACNDGVCSAPVATAKNNVCYAVKATNIYGCSGQDSVCIKVLCKYAQVFIPNAFTPTGSIPENRKFMVRASGIAAVKSFRVFNRWGQVVFERNNFSPNDPAYAWDGTVKGKPADTGVYIYTAEVICENGIPYSYKGDVTLF